MRSRLATLGVVAGMWAIAAVALVPRLPKMSVVSRRLASLWQPSPAGVWVRNSNAEAQLPVAEYQVVKSYLDPSGAGVVVVWRVRNASRTPLEVRLDDLVLTNPHALRCRFRAGALDRPPVTVPPRGVSEELLSVFAMRQPCLRAGEALQLQPKLAQQPNRPAAQRALQEMLGMRIRVTPQPVDEALWHQLMQGP